MSIPGYVSKTQAALMLGVSRPTVRRMIADGKLTTVRIGGLEYLYESDVARLNANAAYVKAVTTGVINALASAGVMTANQRRRAMRSLDR